MTLGPQHSGLQQQEGKEMNGCSMVAFFSFSPCTLMDSAASVEKQEDQH